MTEMQSCEIVMVLDRSGSMASRREETVTGFNLFLKEQKALPGEACLTLVQFDNEYEILHDGVPLANVPELTQATFVPRGNTALFDAIGRAANTAADRIAKMAEETRPTKKVCVVFTDGLENASKEFEAKTIQELVKRLETQNGWQFLFVGASQECLAGAEATGISTTASFDGSKSGATRCAYVQTSGQLCAFRGGGDIDAGAIHG